MSTKKLVGDRDNEPTPAERIEALRERYGERPPPKCWLCKGPMELHGIGPEGKSWYCASNRYIGGTENEKRHFEQSHRQTYDRPDDDVLWLIEENERLLRRSLAEANLLERARQMAAREARGGFDIAKAEQLLEDLTAWSAS